MQDWLPIETAPTDVWSPILLRLRSASGDEAIGSYGWEDESVGEDGEVFIICAWHARDDINNTLGFDPVAWAPIG